VDVVLDQVALGDAELRPEGLLEVRQVHPPLAQDDVDLVPVAWKEAAGGSRRNGRRLAPGPMDGRRGVVLRGARGPGHRVVSPPVPAASEARRFPGEGPRGSGTACRRGTTPPTCSSAAAAPGSRRTSTPTSATGPRT